MRAGRTRPTTQPPNGPEAPHGHLDPGPAARRLADEPVQGPSLFGIGRCNTIQHEPVGVVGLIGPWNAPLVLTIGDAVPALLPGNTVVCKPS